MLASGTPAQLAEILRDHITGYRAAMLAEVAQARLLIVHVSGAQALDEIRRARSRGAAIYVADQIISNPALLDSRSRRATAPRQETPARLP